MQGGQGNQGNQKYQGNERRQGTVGPSSQQALEQVFQQIDKDKRPVGRPRWTEGQTGASQPTLDAVIGRRGEEEEGQKGGEDGMELS